MSAQSDKENGGTSIVAQSSSTRRFGTRIRDSAHNTPTQPLSAKKAASKASRSPARARRRTVKVPKLVSWRDRATEEEYFAVGDDDTGRRKLLDALKLEPTNANNWWRLLQHDPRPDDSRQLKIAKRAVELMRGSRDEHGDAAVPSELFNIHLLVAQLSSTASSAEARECFQAMKVEKIMVGHEEAYFTAFAAFERAQGDSERAAKLIEEGCMAVPEAAARLQAKTATALPPRPPAPTASTQNMPSPRVVTSTKPTTKSTAKPTAKSTAKSTAKPISKPSTKKSATTVLLGMIDDEGNNSQDDDDDITMSLKTPERTQTFVDGKMHSSKRENGVATGTKSTRTRAKSARMTPSASSSLRRGGGMKGTLLGGGPAKRVQQNCMEDDDDDEPTKQVTQPEDDVTQKLKDDDADVPTMSMSEIKKQLKSMVIPACKASSTDETGKIFRQSRTGDKYNKIRKAPLPAVAEGEKEETETSTDMDTEALDKSKSGNWHATQKSRAVSPADTCDVTQGVSFARPLRTPGAPQSSSKGKADMVVPRSTSKSSAVAPMDIFHVKSTKYMKLECIGKGGSSKVFRVMGVKDKQMYALKRIKLTRNDEMTAYENEIKLLRRLCSAETGFKHAEHIVKLFDYEINHARKEVWVVMEKGELDLSNKLQHLRKVDEARGGRGHVDANFVRLAWQQMLQAVEAIHNERIVHADLKPANFLFVDGALKLIDFGIAKPISDDTTNIYRESQVGTLNYMSPEALEADDDDAVKLGRPSDIWSLGCILYQMVFGRTPFAHLKLAQKISAILNPNHNIVFPDLDPSFDQAVLSTIRRCLDRDPAKRPPISGEGGLLNDKFLRPSTSVRDVENVVRELLSLPSTAVGMAPRIAQLLHEQLSSGVAVSLGQFRDSNAKPSSSSRATVSTYCSRNKARAVTQRPNLQTELQGAKKKLTSVRSRHLPANARRPGTQPRGMRDVLEAGLAKMNLPEHENTLHDDDQAFTLHD